MGFLLKYLLLAVLFASCSALKTEDQKSPLDLRLEKEEEAEKNRFAFLPHKRNYVLPFTYTEEPNEKPYAEDYKLQKTEVKFQFSAKCVLLNDPLKWIWEDSDSKLFAGYTNQSHWQAYNNDVSSPFRETNHEPELFLRIKQNWEVLGFTNKLITVGASHQSNGRGGSMSRSWNRIYADFVFERGNFLLSFKPWYRLPEEKKRSPDDADGDDNRDIAKYMGYGEIRAYYKISDHIFSAMGRNNLRSHNKGAFEIGWSYPVWKKIRLFATYFHGYGESLIDYDYNTNRFGVGLEYSGVF